jgi:uncharacterized RmlC-like cupin family protein
VTDAPPLQPGHSHAGPTVPARSAILAEPTHAKESRMTDPTPDCRLFRPGETYRGKQGFDYFAGISAESAGSRGICMHLLTIPPGARAKAHLHESHETAIYVLSGVSETTAPGSSGTWW